MRRINASDPESKSADIVASNIEQLKALFPDAVTEGGVDFVVLTQLLSAAADDGDEKYGLNWHGKKRARQLALTASTGTLRPCPKEGVDWDTTQNLMIEGDNLEVLKLLQKSYAGKVKLIYIDPPYNTGKDFVYKDDYQDNIKNYLMLTGQIDSDGRKISSNTESSGRFHTDWLNMMYPRLKLARNLLRRDGAMFVSIDDGELATLKLVLADLFGEENFRADIVWQKRYTRSNNTIDFTAVVEHVLVYSRSEDFAVNLLPRTEEADSRYFNPDDDPRGPWKGASFLNPATPQQRPNLSYDIVNPNTGQVTKPTANAWRRSRDEFERLQSEARLYWGSDGKQAVPSIKMFLSDARELTPTTFWDHEYAGNTDLGTRDLKDLLGDRIFDNPKPVQLLRRVLEHGTDADSLVLDFFAGSGTTAQAVMTLNAADGGRRRFILVQLPEPLDSHDRDQAAAEHSSRNLRLRPFVSEITKERLRRAGLKVRDDAPLFKGDVGMRVFKLDTSNIKEWAPTVGDSLETSLQSAVQHLQVDRTEEDILFELILKLGLDLCVAVETRTVAGLRVFGVARGVLFACLAPSIGRDRIESLATTIVDWSRGAGFVGDIACVFRDDAFDDDVSKLNLAAILEQAGISTIRSV